MLNRRAFITLLGGSVVAAADRASAQGPPPGKGGGGWAAGAEEEFGIGAGMGPKLMTEQEWKEHHAKMRTLKGAERDTYRRETHTKMAARAKERGIEMHPRHGAGGGPGRGPTQ
jgi:hypothetical protein